MRGHIKKREWLDGKALSTDPAKRKQQVREITARARAEGRTLAPIRVTYQARIPDPRNRRKDLVKTFDRKRDGERWLASTATAATTSTRAAVRRCSRRWRKSGEARGPISRPRRASGTSRSSTGTCSRSSGGRASRRSRRRPSSCS